MPYYLGKLTAAGDQKLSKTVDASGHIKPAASLYAGRYETLEVGDLKELAEILGNLSPNEALTLGVWLDGFAEGKLKAALTTRRKLPEIQEKYPNVDWITRTKDFITFADDLPGFLYLDLDDLNMTLDNALRIIASVWPGFEKLGKVITAGSSSFLYNKEGEEVKGANSWHVWIPVSKGLEEAASLGRRIFDRLVAQGYGYTFVDKVYRVHVKTLIDTAVFSAERIVFEAGMIIDPKSGWRSERPEPQIMEGEDLDILKTLDDWKGSETADRERGAAERMRLIDKETVRLASDRKKWMESESRKLAKKLGISRQNATEVLNAKQVNILFASEKIVLDDDSEVRIADILLEPESWADETLPDPVDPHYRGVNGGYGYGKAKIMVTEEGEPFIHSFAHGGIVYKLKWDFETLRKLAEDKPRWLYDRLDQLVVNAGDIVLNDSQIRTIAKTCVDGLDPDDFAGRGGLRSAAADIKSELKDKSLKSIEEMVLKEKGEHFEEMYLDAMNYQWAAGFIGESYRIVRIEEDDQGPQFLILKKQDFVNYYEDKRVIFYDIMGRPKDVSIAEAWLQTEGHKKFVKAAFAPFGGQDAIVFEEDGLNWEFCLTPRKDGDYTLNLWTGIIVSRKNWNSLNGRPESGCEKILNHIKDVWCSGNNTYFEKMIGWLADMFQNPHLQVPLIPVLKSDQGAGKNIIIDNVIADLLGRAAMVTSSKEDVIGRFATLADKVFVCYNEAVWGGQHEANSALKALADKRLRYEMKGINVVFMKNHLHILILSNNSWSAPVETSDRRFFYPPVSEHTIGNAEYFMALKEEIANGGKEAFLKLMLNKDLSDYDRYTLPDEETPEKFHTKLKSSPEIRFVYEILSNPEFLDEFETAAQWVLPAREGGNFVWFKKAEFFRKGFKEFLRMEGDRFYNDSQQQFFMRLAKHGLYGSSRVDTMSPENALWESVRTRERGVRMWVLKPTGNLDELRKKFQKAMKVSSEIWDEAE